MAACQSTKRAHNFKDLTGQVFGRWTVIRYHATVIKKSVWWCRCECGTEKGVKGADLVKGKSTNCGCHRMDGPRDAATTHGMSKTGEHNIWMNMIQRCCNPSNQKYFRWGGRGITVCERWLESFENFLADMGPRPSAKHTIERNDNNAGYCKENCTWETRKTQARNTRRNHLLTFDGRTQSLAAWADEVGLSYFVLRSRINKGWTVEKALTEVPMKKHMLTFRGKTQTLTEWARELGMSPHTLSGRIVSYGWSVERALTEGVRHWPTE